MQAKRLPENLFRQPYLYQSKNNLELNTQKALICRRLPEQNGLSVSTLLNLLAKHPITPILVGVP
jgi:hypothetical protein